MAIRKFDLRDTATPEPSYEPAPATGMFALWRERVAPLRDAIRVEKDVMDYAHRLAQEQPNFEERRKRWDVPPAVEVSPQPNGLAALMFIPLAGLLVGIVLWRWVSRAPKERGSDGI